MLKAQTFMKLFFHSRTKYLKRESRRRSQFQKQFFASESPFDRLDANSIMESQLEKILSIETARTEAEVITLRQQSVRWRYYLENNRVKWLIRTIERECLSCNGAPGNHCLLCRGKGWRGTYNPSSIKEGLINQNINRQAAKLQGLDQNYFPRKTLISDAIRYDSTDIIQEVIDFMYKFFCARTAEIKRDLEDRAPFRKKYFLGGFEIDSVVVLNSELEMIVNVDVIGENAEVITQSRNFIPRRRYQLEFHNSSWQIQRIYYECRDCHGNVGNTGCTCEGRGWLQSNWL